MSPISISARATSTTRLKPYLSISAAVNGAIRPNRTIRSASATDICSVLQPNSLVSGTIERAGDAHAAGGGQREEKDDGDDRPAVMDAGALEPPRQGLSEHAGSLRALSTRPAPIRQKDGLTP